MKIFAELLDLQADKVVKESFSRKCLTQFLAQLKDRPISKRESEKALLPFPTIYLCEARFSVLVIIKTKYINRLDAQHDMRCALSMNINSNIEELMKVFSTKKVINIKFNLINEFHVKLQSKKLINSYNI